MVLKSAFFLFLISLHFLFLLVLHIYILFMSLVHSCDFIFLLLFLPFLLCICGAADISLFKFLIFKVRIFFRVYIPKWNYF